MTHRPNLFSCRFAAEFASDFYCHNPGGNEGKDDCHGAAWDQICTD